MRSAVAVINRRKKEVPSSAIKFSITPQYSSLGFPLQVRRTLPSPSSYQTKLSSVSSTVLRRSMVNFTSHTADTYAASPFMPFAGVEAAGSTPKSHNHQAWDWDAVNSFPFYTPPLLDCPPPPLFSIPPPPLPPPAPAPSMVVPEYARPEGFFKLEDDLAAGFGGQGSARIGLNLGHRTYFSSYDQLLLFGRSSHHQPPRCQAEGCMADLSGAKHYHRRHKVCDYHSKAPDVFFPGGVQQRFCQQCSRFHGLAEFDDSKRSCRKRLAEHNRRRRKPQSQPSIKAGSSSPSPATNAKPKEESKLSASVQPNNLSAPRFSTSGSGDHRQKKVAQSKNTSGSALSLGGAAGFNNKISPLAYIEDKAPQYHHHQQQQQQQYMCQFASPSSPSTAFFPHQSPYSEGSHSGAGGPAAAQQHQSSILQLGQAMFEWDFI